MQDIEEWELRIWNKILHGRFWIRELIYTQRRAELYKHIAKHWNELFPLGASEEFDPNRKIYD